MSRVVGAVSFILSEGVLTQTKCSQDGMTCIERWEFPFQRSQIGMGACIVLREKQKDLQAL